MRYHHFHAHAVTVEGYGDPEIIVEVCRHNPATDDCEAAYPVDRHPLSGVERRPLSGGPWRGRESDPTAVLEDFGWRVRPDDLPEGGWDTTDYGAVALVDPIDLDADME
jgi:hypothetical protein